MFDAMKLLDQFVGAGTAQRIDQMAGGRLGNLQNAWNERGVQGVADAAKGFVQDNKTGLAVGALGALLLGTRTGRSVGGTALKLGGLALVGGLAYSAFRNWQQGRAPQEASGTLAAPTADSGFATPAAPDAQERAVAAIRAMIAAAKSDGHIDNLEHSRIVGRFQDLGIDAEAQSFLAAEMAKPLDIAALAATATTMERAVEIYAASVVAIDPDTDAEHAYLDALAARLSLDPHLRAHLDAQAAAVRQS